MVLTEKDIQIVKATVPAIQAHGSAITGRMYQLLFDRHPEVRDYFAAARNQPEKLAGAILAYATYIDDLPKLEAAVAHITARHAASGVMPEHYDAVGAAVLQAIKEVLGEAATAEVLQAWGHAYGFLASVFKEKEAGLYQSMSRKRA
ncbi:MAG: globin domain-containing protein [Gammaproteobacteria bacterium]